MQNLLKTKLCVGVIGEMKIPSSKGGTKGSTGFGVFEKPVGFYARDFINLNSNKILCSEINSLVVGK